MGKDKVGKLIANRYRLIERAGEGGMAVVWRAQVRGAGKFVRNVALKRIRVHSQQDAHLIDLFEEEARVGASISHPNVVRIEDFGVDDEGRYYLVMEWVEGMDLHQFVSSFRGGLRTPWPLLSAIAIEALRGLHAAHERRGPEGQIAPVFHRDVSPSNVLLGTDGTAKITDFGLARAMDRASMTQPRHLKGKLCYSAPEMITGAPPTAQTDLFALGVVLWEALAQRRLFAGTNAREILLAVKNSEIERLTQHRPDVPEELADVVHKALAKAPADRFPSATAMARALAAILRKHPEPTDAEPLGRAVRAARDRLGMGAEGGAKPSPF